MRHQQVEGRETPRWSRVRQWTPRAATGDCTRTALRHATAQPCTVQPCGGRQRRARTVMVAESRRPSHHRLTPPPCRAALQLTRKYGEFWSRPLAQLKKARAQKENLLKE